MADSSFSNSIKRNLPRILAAIENYQHVDRGATGMVFTDNWYDSHPRLLIFDPVLSPYDKLVWLAIRSRCTPDMSLASFPSYDEIQALLSISRGTVSSSISKLRMTRWITVLCRDQVRNDAGQITKDGNIYMVHGEPLGMSDTFELDANYMGYVNECRKHRHAEVRKIAEVILSSLRHEMSLGQNVLEHKHPFERRAEAWLCIEGETESSFFGTYSCLQKAQTQPDGNRVRNKQISKHSTVVHQMNYGVSDLSNSGNSEDPVHRDSVVHTSSKEVVEKNNYNICDTSSKTELADNLVFPESVTENQKHLINLSLRRLPATLPPPPKPWESWHQLLLDELDGRIKAGQSSKCAPVWNPVSLMVTYCKRLVQNGIGFREDGQFQVENAEHVHTQRIEKAKQEKLFNQTKERYRQRTLEMAMKSQAKNPHNSHGLRKPNLKNSHKKRNSRPA